MWNLKIPQDHHFLQSLTLNIYYYSLRTLGCPAENLEFMACLNADNITSTLGDILS